MMRNNEVRGLEALERDFGYKKNSVFSVLSVAKRKSEHGFHGKDGKRSGKS